MKPTLLPAFLLASLLSLPFVLAQDASPPAAASDAVALEQLPERLQKLDDEIARKLEEVRTLVNREAAAKNITEAVAQSLRWSLRTTATAGAAVDVRGIVATMRVPTENAALTQAIKELETTYGAAQTQRLVLAGEAAREIRRRISEAIRSATKPTELEAMETSLTKANQALRKYAALASTESVTSFSNAERVLRGLRRLLETETAGRLEALAQAMSQLRSDSNYGQEPSFNADIQARLDRVTQPVLDAAEKAEDQVTAAIVALKPAAEIDAALLRFEESGERLTALRQGQNLYGQKDLRQSAASYRLIARAVAALADGDGDNTGNQMNEARNAVRQLGGKRAAALDPLLAKLEAQTAERAAKMAAERGEKLRARLAAVKQPAELNEIAADLRRWESAPARSGRSENWSELAGQLGILSAAWATQNPALLQQNRFNGGERLSGPFAGELAALQKRVEREVLSRALAAPELTAPPLAEKPADTALDALCDQLAAGGEWRRLYDLLNARASIEANTRQRSPDEAIVALRAFFTGQNLELAEQWGDAMQSYKAVLRSASPRAPTKPAAERIKMLAKEHPEAAKSSAPPERPNFPEQ